MSHPPILINKIALIMATRTYSPAQSFIEQAPHLTSKNRRQATLTDKNGEKRLYWYLLTVLLQTLLFIPLPLVLIYFYHASATILIVTSGLFLLTLVRTFLVELCAR